MGKVFLHTENGIAFWKESLAINKESGEVFPFEEKLMEVEGCFACTAPVDILERLGKKAAKDTPDFLLFISSEGNRRILKKDSEEYIEILESIRK